MLVEEEEERKKERKKEREDEIFSFFFPMQISNLLFIDFLFFLSLTLAFSLFVCVVCNGYHTLWFFFNLWRKREKIIITVTNQYQIKSLIVYKNII